MATDTYFDKKFRDFSRKFLNFFDLFEGFRRFSDLFGPVWTRSDAFGCIRMRLDLFGTFWRNFSVRKFFRTRFSQDLEELRQNGRQNRIPRNFLL